ncbi:MAG: alpha/beta hydrolase [Deltaproteobacteria bacterium]|nr:alpha/beta hydrolase [Deltaproteobacteria bacterium]
MPTLEVDGREIHYLTGVNGVAPERRSIVFVHGAGGTGMVWQNQRRGLDRGVNTICLDLPGHGQSHGAGCTTIAEYSGWLIRFMQRLELSGPIVAGHSMGGAVVLEAAIEYPEEFDGLILISSGARLRVSSEILQGIEADFEATAEQLVQRCYGPGTSEKVIQWGLEQLLAEQPEVVLNDFKACNEFDKLGKIGSIKHPALVICGSEDSMTPPKYSQYLADNLRRATLRIIDGAGHMVMVEDAFKVNASILKFLATL